MTQNRVLLGVALTLSIITAGQTIATASSANTFDKNCRPQTGQSELDRWSIFYRGNFVTQQQPYSLLAGRFQDGSVRLCLVRTQPNSTRLLSTGLVRTPQLQNQFIDRVTQVGKQPVFRVVLREGNGIRVPVKEYRLDLTQPDRPQLQLLRSWRE